jgi:serine/threonine-protein kinase
MSLGTPVYVSPEQAAGDPGLDHRADIYSLGVVGYELICGHPPFSGRTPAAIFAAHAHDDPVPISQNRRDVPAFLEKIVMQCLEKRPDDRPQNAADIVRILRGTPIRGSAAVRASMRRIPAWVPWTVAGATTLIAIVLSLKLAGVV